MERREFLKRIGAGGAALVWAGRGAAETQGPQPNMVFIIADDMA